MTAIEAPGSTDAAPGAPPRRGDARRGHRWSASLARWLVGPDAAGAARPRRPSRDHPARPRARLLVERDAARQRLPYEFIASALRAADRLGLRLDLAMELDREFVVAGFSPAVLADPAVDGWLIDGSGGVPAAGAAAAGRSPVVWVDAPFATGAVHRDEVGAGRLATAELIARGHRRIAFVESDADYGWRLGHPRADDRSVGYADAMRDAGLPADARPRRLERGRTAGIASAMAYLSLPARPTACVCATPTALEVLHAAAIAIGLNVPRDLALIAIADRPLDGAGAVTACVVHDWEAIGAAAVAALADRLAGAGPSRSTVIAPRITGATALAPPLLPPAVARAASAARG